MAKDGPKALLFTEKGTTSALLKSIAIDFLDVISVGQVRNKDTAVVEKFGIEKFPTLLLIPTEGEPIVYNGELNKKDMVAFLKQAGEPNPDPAPAKAKAPKADKKKKTTEKAKKADKAEKAEKAEEKVEEKVVPEPEPEESPADSTPEATQEATPEIIPIQTLVAQDDLIRNCLHPKAQTCVLALVAAWESELTAQAVSSLSKLSTKYIQGHRHLFPFYAVPNIVENSDALRKALEIGENVEIVAINARRGWWRHYKGDFSLESVEAWLDAMRMGEGKKNKLPEGIVQELPEPPAEEAPVSEGEPVAEPSVESEATQATDPEPEVETETPVAEKKEEPRHEEL